MQVVFKTQALVKFDDLSPGDVFSFENDFYMKVENLYLQQNDHTSNAITFDGELAGFKPLDEVQHHANAKVVIE